MRQVYDLGDSHVTLRDIYEAWRQTQLTPELVESAFMQHSVDLVDLEFVIQNIRSQNTSRSGRLVIRVSAQLEGTV